MDRTITRTNRPFHPGFTPAAFDASLHRAFCEGQAAREIGSGQWVVTSGSAANVSYLTTTRACACKAHVMRGRCDHRALALFLAWEDRQRTATPQTAA